MGMSGEKWSSDSDSVAMTKYGKFEDYNIVVIGPGTYLISFELFLLCCVAVCTCVYVCLCLSVSKYLKFYT